MGWKMGTLNARYVRKWRLYMPVKYVEEEFVRIISVLMIEYVLSVKKVYAKYVENI